MGAPEDEGAAAMRRLNETKRFAWQDASAWQIGSQDLPAPRNSQGECVHESKLFIYGGRGPQGRLNDLWCYDMDSRQWECLVANNSKEAIDLRSGCLLEHDGLHTLYVGFGFTEFPVARSDVYAFDLYTGKFSGPISIQGTSPPPRVNFRSWFLDGSLWLYGGSPDGVQCLDDLWSLDVRTRIWTQHRARGKAPPAAQWVSCLRHRDEQVILFGGHGDDSLPVKLFHMLDCRKMVWTDLTEGFERPATVRPILGHSHMNVVAEGEVPPEDSEPVRWEHLMCSTPATTLVGDHLVVWGGWTGVEHRSDLWLCHLPSLKWDRIEPAESAPLYNPNARCSASAIVYNDKLMICMGWDGWAQTNQMHIMSLQFPSLQRMCAVKVMSCPSLHRSRQVDEERFRHLLV